MTLTEGHPHRWTSTNVEAARELANTISQPRGHQGQTPEETWQQRTLITIDERVVFQEAVNVQRLVARQYLGLPETGDLARDRRPRSSGPSASGPSGDPARLGAGRLPHEAPRRPATAQTKAALERRTGSPRRRVPLDTAAQRDVIAVVTSGNNSARLPAAFCYNGRASGRPRRRVIARQDTSTGSP